MSEDKKLTLKQRKWLDKYLECGNAKKAAMEVYDCTEDSAGQIGYENLKKLDYSDFLEAAGITDKLLQEKLLEGLNSTRVKTSLTEPDRIVDDMPTRHKYLETALKLKKRLIEKDININVDKMLILDAHGTNINEATDELAEQTEASS